MRDVEVPEWLKSLPLAPEFRPTDTEFADPIAYISKIEKEASVFGICKVIPPLPKPSKKYVLHNLNQSLLKCPELGSDVNVCSTLKTTDNGGEGNNNGVEARAVFTTRHQELGNSGKRSKGVGGNQMFAAHKQVWQSGEVYTIEQFEAKAKNFARSQLSSIKDVSPLVVESMFWKAASEKPIYLEYANDVPGSGFGEPEGLFRYFHRRRRRRKRGTFNRNSKVGSSDKDGQVGYVNSTSCADSCSKDNSSLHKDTSNTSSSLLHTLSEQAALTSRRKSSSACTDVEGTAGWKLSNCPWNLQVIARSPGSLTRFMPDDIPGVTSPMIYIGMLFSWFAWHVEDHELHSLNFLHMGSPKTWYAVPGDNAVAFEEVIRHHAYGGNIDGLAALSLLGEKTTLLSPEVVVASGIPCCRLVQNPGEFVVTFPRAYHVGFSHGFNCGEAANFGTPQWLAVANEAAVRRAAMNYLPMLSHQQLMYLLTMSFVSRVPRSLIPGVRSSRSRDRQKEDRERLVKKAFIEDILKENKLLSVLLKKSSSYRVVEWNLESLPSSVKGTEMNYQIDTIPTTSSENESGKANKPDLSAEMSLYMDTIDNFYEDDDNLCDFRIDSGTLPCVACGILGFPFMAVLQPSENALRDLSFDDEVATQNAGAFEHLESHSTLDFNGIANSSDQDKLNPTRNICRDPDVASSIAHSSQSTFSVAEDQPRGADYSSSLKCGPVNVVKLHEGWNNSNRFSRPRIFCLEHATQTEELLCSQGGANVLVICHSDFRRIRAHVAVVAEEIGTTFNYEEITFDNASEEDLNLIDLATDNEEQECGEDWTSRLNINLRCCMELRKKSPSAKVQHALRLGGLFSVTNQSSNSMSLIWQSRKSRSKRCSNHLVQNKLSTNSQMETNEGLIRNSDSPVVNKEGQFRIDENEANPDGQMTRKVNIIIQYSRRKYKSKPSVSSAVNDASTDPKLLLPSELSCVGHGRPAAETSNNNNDTLLAVIADLLVDTAPAIGNIEAEAMNFELQRPTMETAVSNLTSHISQMPQKINSVEDSEKSSVGVSENSAGLTETVRRSSENCETTEVNPTEKKTWITNPLEAGDLNRESNTHAIGDVLMVEASDASNSSMSSSGSPSPDIRHEHMGKSGENHQGLESEVMDPSTFNNEGLRERQATYRDGQDEAVVVNESTSSLVEDVRVLKETNASEDSRADGADRCEVEEAMELDKNRFTVAHVSQSAKSKRKRKREMDLVKEAQISSNGFVKSPCESLRPRSRKDTVMNETACKKPIDRQKERKQADDLSPHTDAKQQKKGSRMCKNAVQPKKASHKCDIESCGMSFHTKADLLLHKRNTCTHKGCGKTFSAHKYVILHQRVHADDRPLKCSWEGCTMSFKWAWARTEHLRVHTGERPYKCKVDGCGQTFRFVSDYSRHRRKTGHYVVED